MVNGQLLFQALLLCMPIAYMCISSALSEIYCTGCLPGGRINRDSICCNCIVAQKPTMKLAPEICDYIAAYWMDIGYCLDFDDDGNEVDTIENGGNGNPKKCCTLMLKTWIQGDKGKQPKTWQTLLDILISLDRKTAHDKVKERLQYIQSKQQQKAQESIKVSQPVEETATDSAMLSVSSTYRNKSPDSIKRHLNNMSLPRDSEAFECQSEQYSVDSSED